MQANLNIHINKKEKKKERLRTNFCQIDEFLEFVISCVEWFVVFWASGPFCD
jgi:hypothetical protein